MFIKIDQVLDGRIDEGDDRLVDLIDAALVAHKMSNIILILSRSQLKLIEGSSHFSSPGKKTAALISQRSSDYRAALGSVHYSLVICGDEKTRSVLIQDREAFVNLRLLSHNHLLWNSFLMCENMSDVGYFFFLSKAYATHQAFPETYLSMRPVAGGGSQLFQAIHAEAVRPLKGVVICDADKLDLYPPFKHGSTASKAFQALTHLGECDNPGISTLNPMLAFFAGPGLTVENFVGPHLLQVYFDANNRPVERKVITDAFPTFPNLDDVDALMWRSLNLKDGTKSLAAQYDLVKKRTGKAPTSLVARAKWLVNTIIPGDAISWIVKSESDSRWIREIEAAFRRDLKIPGYEAAIAPICDGMRTLLAGDTTARFY